MLFILIPLRPDAESFIEYYGLKKDLFVRPFEIYKNNETVLCITGESPANAACAVGFLFGRYADNTDAPDWLMYMSIAGETENDCNSGDVLYPHTLTDGSYVYQGAKRTALFAPADGCSRAKTLKNFQKMFSLVSISPCAMYPDMLYNHPFRECALDDTQAACVFRAASRFLPPDRIFIFIAVNDMTAAAGKIMPWLENVRKASAGDSLFTEEERSRLDIIMNNLRLTHEMKRMLTRDALAFRTGGGNLMEALGRFTECMGASKDEGKRLFHELQKALRL